MITGDHPATAAAIATEVGLRDRRRSRPVRRRAARATRSVLGALLDQDGIVVARVSPEDKLRIARALRARGHVVAMTGDGVNDGPALHEADIGIAMGLSGTDVAREAADLVLLDDHFATIVAGIEQGRATYSTSAASSPTTSPTTSPSSRRSWCGRSPAAASRSRSACCRSSPSTSAPTRCPRWPSAPSRPDGTCSTARPSPGGC